MNLNRRSNGASPLAALSLSLTLLACGGSPASMEGDLVPVAQNRSQVHDKGKELIVQPPKMPHERVVTDADPTDRRPEAFPPAACAWPADELAPVNGGTEVQQEPESDVAVDALVPVPAPRSLTDEPR